MGFYQKTKNFIVTALGVLWTDAAYACSVCFTQVEDDPQAIALKWSVLTLFAVVLMVLGFTGKFMWDIARREKLLMAEEQG